MAIAAVLPAIANAETVDRFRLPTPSSDKPAAKQPAPRNAAACAALGPGFVQLEGSTTCVKIGGATSVGAGGRTTR